MNNKVCVLSTAYLPPIEYFAVLHSYDKIFIEKFENYPKQTYRNRCYILSPNGRMPLTVPASKGDAVKMHTSDISIVYKEQWNIKNWRAIETAYNNSAYFLYYRDELESIHNNGNTSLLNYNQELVKEICSLLGISTQKIAFTSEFIKEYPEDVDDYRELIHPKKKNIYTPSCDCKYFQVFESKFGFVYNLSILDLLFNEGTQALDFISEILK